MPRVLLIAAVVVLVSAATAVLAAEPRPRAELVPESRAALFDAANLRPGERRSACLGVANRGEAAGRAALYAAGVRGGLAPYLRLTVTRGRRAAGPSTSCKGFVEDRGGVLFRGTLSDFPASLADAALDAAEAPAGGRRAYRFALELADEPGAAGRSARWDWRLAVESLPVAARSASRSGCAVLQLAGRVDGRTRTLTRVVRINRRVRAVLQLRTFGSAGATRVVVTTGLRVRGDHALLIPDWADVRYRLDGERAAVASDRPFRARLAAAAFTPGRNRVSVAVHARRSPKRVTAFDLRVTPATIAGRTVCVVSA